MTQPFDDRRDENPASGSTEPAPRPQAVRVALPQSAPYVTYTVLGLTVFVYVLQLASQFLLQVDFPVGLLAKSNELIREGQFWRLVTPALVHGSIAHIGFNMYALLSFGTGLEQAFGHSRFLVLYLLGAFTGNVLSFLFTDAEGILSQQLLPKKTGAGRCLAIEILVPNPAIRNLIREDKVHQLYSIMQTGQAKSGMQTMNQSLFELYIKGTISYEEAMGRSMVPEELLTMIQKVSTTTKGRG